MIPKIIYQGVLYTAEPTRPGYPDNWKGFGGRKFTVVFKSGQVHKTDNLFLCYCQPKEAVEDTCEIFQGWEPVRQENLCLWAWCGGNQYFLPVGGKA